MVAVAIFAATPLCIGLLEGNLALYELLTGQLPAAATDRFHSETLIPPRQLVPNLTVQMEKIILTGMRMQVEDRFQTADELIDALKGKLKVWWSGLFHSSSITHAHRNLFLC